MLCTKYFSTYQYIHLNVIYLIHISTTMQSIIISTINLKHFFSEVFKDITIVTVTSSVYNIIQNIIFKKKFSL